MRVCGIIAEYNPFHTGHLYHLTETRRRLGRTDRKTDTIIVCAMSGNFVQRGDFALLDKYARAEMAVRCGADLVVELPLAAALSSAQGFARGAVGVLHALGCDTISFGAETPDLSLLQAAANASDSLHNTETTPQYSYAARRQAELETIHPAAAALLDSPNNTLGVEYCRAMRDRAIRPLAIQRLGAAHDSNQTADGFVSAGFLRARLRTNGAHVLPACQAYLPPAAYQILYDAIQRGTAPVTLPDHRIFFLLRRLLYEGRLITGSKDGFDERLQKAVFAAGSFQEAVRRARTKRFPAARIRRVLLRAALSVPADCPVLPYYLRVLAIGRRGRLLLKQARLPVIVKPAAEKKMPAALQSLLQRDAFADDLFALAFPEESLRAGGWHYRRTPFCDKEPVLERDR